MVSNWDERDGWIEADWDPAKEISLTLFLDGAEMATILCTPEKLNALVVGFLRSEGIIERLEDIVLMRVCEDEGVADVRLARPSKVPEKRILTSGCGVGVTFESGSSLVPIRSGYRSNPGQVISCMKQLLHSDGGRNTKGGLHLSALSDGESLLVVSRDVGRHNTLDKIFGECLFRGIETRDRMLLTTGRISSEMVAKAVKMGVPLAASINSPTDRAVRLAEEMGVAVVGYARAGKLTAYSHLERLRG